MTLLEMASAVHREKSVFLSSLRPYRFSLLYLSHETKGDGKETTKEHVGRNKDGFFHFRTVKCAPKVQSMVALGVPLN